MAHRGRTAALTLLIGALGLATVWGGGLTANTPLYDGLCTNGGYVYGAGVTASETIPVVKGDIQTTEVMTPGQVPEATMIVASGTLDIPSGATSLTLAITPISAPKVIPGNGSVDGNVYNITATTNTGKPATVISGNDFTIVLLQTSTNGTHVVDQFVNNEWKPQQVFGQGCLNELAVQATSFGTYAVVTVGAANSNPPPASSGGPPTFLIIGALLLIFVALLVVTRRFRGPA